MRIKYNIEVNSHPTTILMRIILFVIAGHCMVSITTLIDDSEKSHYDYNRSLLNLELQFSTTFTISQIG